MKKVLCVLLTVVLFLGCSAGNTAERYLVGEWETIGAYVRGTFEPANDSNSVMRLVLNPDGNAYMIVNGVSNEFLWRANNTTFTMIVGDHESRMSYFIRDGRLILGDPAAVGSSHYAVMGVLERVQ